MPHHSPVSARRTVVLPSLAGSRKTDRRLREIFRRAVRQALAPGLALGFLACSDPLSVDPGEGGRPVDQVVDSGGIAFDSAARADRTDSGVPTQDGPAGWSRLMCENGRWNPVADLLPAEPVDYVSYLTGASEVASSGEPCRTAMDKPTCLAMLAAAKRDATLVGRCNPGGCAPFLVATRGDRILRIATQAELLAFLGRIDAPADALLLAFFNGYHLACASDDSGWRVAPGGFEVKTTRMVSDCPVKWSAFVIFVAADGQITVREERPIPMMGPGCIGRRPDGLQGSDSATSCTTLRSFLAESARLEAASVSAFRFLARDLRRLGAPERLVARARRSARDETRHARLVAALAARHGAVVAAPRVADTGAKDLWTLAAENATEGCVRETFGAVAAGFQARAAGDPVIARTMAELAQDETRHAQLAWQVARWAEAKLGSGKRREIGRLRRAAVSELRAEMLVPRAAEMYTAAGWPRPEQATVLLDALDETIWSGG